MGRQLGRSLQPRPQLQKGAPLTDYRRCALGDLRPMTYRRPSSALQFGLLKSRRLGTEVGEVLAPPAAGCRLGATTRHSSTT